MSGRNNDVPEDPNRWEFSVWDPPITHQPIQYTKQEVAPQNTEVYVGDPQTGFCIGGQLSSHSGPIQPAPFTVRRNYLLPFM